MQLEFKIENQSITRIDKNFVVEKSQNYLYAKFDFKTDDWEKVITKYAIFSNENYKDENSVMVEIKEDFTCLVPAQILLNSCCFKINVVGLNESGDYILTTNLSNVSLMSTGSTMGINPNEPQPSVITDILEKVSKSFSNFNFTYNPDNGYLVLQLIDNNKVISEQVVDLPTEQIIKNVSYNETTKKLTIEWANGQVSNIDFSTIIQDFYTKTETDIKLNDLIKYQLLTRTITDTSTVFTTRPLVVGVDYNKYKEFNIIFEFENITLGNNNSNIFVFELSSQDWANGGLTSRGDWFGWGDWCPNYGGVEGAIGYPSISGWNNDFLGGVKDSNVKLSISFTKDNRFTASAEITPKSGAYKGIKGYVYYQTKNLTEYLKDYTKDLYIAIGHDAQCNIKINKMYFTKGNYSMIQSYGVNQVASTYNIDNILYNDSKTLNFVDTTARNEITGLNLAREEKEIQLKSASGTVLSQVTLPVQMIEILEEGDE